MRYYIGVDIGLSGGIAVIDDGGQVVFHTVMPVLKSKTRNDYDIQQIVEIFNTWQPSITYVEKAMIIPVSGRNAIASLGRALGLFEGILSASKLSYEVIQPQRWQKAIFAGMAKSDTKQASISFCRKMWPTVDWRATERSVNYHDGKCDAACLALYAKRMN